MMESAATKKNPFLITVHTNNVLQVLNCKMEEFHCLPSTSGMRTREGSFAAMRIELCGSPVTTSINRRLKAQSFFLFPVAIHHAVCTPQLARTASWQAVPNDAEGVPAYKADPEAKALPCTCHCHGCGM